MNQSALQTTTRPHTVSKDKLRLRARLRIRERLRIHLAPHRKSRLLSRPRSRSSQSRPDKCTRQSPACAPHITGAPLGDSRLLECFGQQPLAGYRQRGTSPWTTTCVETRVTFSRRPSNGRIRRQFWHLPSVLLSWCKSVSEVWKSKNVHAILACRMRESAYCRQQGPFATVSLILMAVLQ